MLLENKTSNLKRSVTDIVFYAGVEERFEDRVFYAACLSDGVLLRSIVKCEDGQGHACSESDSLSKNRNIIKATSSTNSFKKHFVKRFFLES